MTLASSNALGYLWGEHLCGMYSKFIDKPFLTIPKIIESDVILLITISYVTRLKF